MPLITGNEAPCLFHISSERGVFWRAVVIIIFFATSFKTFIIILFPSTTQWQMHLMFLIASGSLICLMKSGYSTYSALLIDKSNLGPCDSLQLAESQQLKEKQPKLPFTYPYWPILLSFAPPNFNGLKGPREALIQYCFPCHISPRILASTNPNTEDQNRGTSHIFRLTIKYNNWLLSALSMGLCISFPFQSITNRPVE